jgi:hypothetical protein
LDDRVTRRQLLDLSVDLVASVDDGGDDLAGQAGGVIGRPLVAHPALQDAARGVLAEVGLEDRSQG